MIEWPKFSLKKIQIDGKCEAFFLLTKAETDGVSLELVNGVESFRGKILTESHRSHQQSSRLDDETFVRLTISALTNVETNDDDFSYTLQSSAKQWTFAWKKYIPAEDIKFQLGSAKLKSVASTEMVTEFLTSAASHIAFLEKNVDVLEKEKATVQAENEKLVETLRERVLEKQEIERRLMTKFALVLNKKKEKLKELQLELQENGEQAESSVPESRDPPQKIASPDSSFRFSEEDLNMPTTSKHVRRVRAPNNSNPSTPPVTKKKLYKKKDLDDFDLECENTLELMDNM